MENTISFYEVLHPFTIGIIISIFVGIFAIKYVGFKQKLREYENTKESYKQELTDFLKKESTDLEKEQNSDLSEQSNSDSQEKSDNPKPPSKPCMVDHFLGFIWLSLIVLIGGVLVLSAQSESFNRSYTEFSEAKNDAEKMGKNLHPDIAHILAVWPRVVQEQKMTGEIESYEEAFSKANDMRWSDIASEDKHTLAEFLATRCFGQHYEDSKLEQILQTYPADEDDFKNFWNDMAYEVSYTRDPACAPSRVFKNLGIKDSPIRL